MNDLAANIDRRLRAAGFDPHELCECGHERRDHFNADVERRRLVDRRRRERELGVVVGSPDEPAMARETWERHEELIAVAETVGLGPADTAELGRLCAAWKRMLDDARGRARSTA